MRDLQFDGSCKSMCSFQWPRTAALSQDVRKKNRLNVNPEIPVRKGGAADTHTHTCTQQTHKDTKIDQEEIVLICLVACSQCVAPNADAANS